MACSDKLFFLEAYFEDLEQKINRLPKLNGKPFQDEALILCIVYIDWLASGYYFDGCENNKQKFCHALIKLSGNAFFGMIHPKELLDATRSRGETVEALIASVIKMYPKQFLTQDNVAEYIQSSSLSDSDKSSLIDNLWRVSVAAICYERIRCQAVHGPGYNSSLSFDETKYEGKNGMKIDFPMIHAALGSIFETVRVTSTQNGKWFGILFMDKEVCS